jgi:hypothetical protein
VQKQVVGFFIFCASEMERMDAKHDHIHLSDKHKEFEGSSHFALMKNEK